MSEISAFINEYLNKGNINFKKHALVRIVERKISIQEVEEALSNCSIIESYSEDKPLPSYLVIGFTKNERPLHILVALDKIEGYIWIITVYEPDQTIWSNQMTKRKKL